MCSDVVVYPYQIYQARLAGADALKLLAPALPAKVGLATTLRHEVTSVFVIHEIDLDPRVRLTCLRPNTQYTCSREF